MLIPGSDPRPHWLLLRTKPKQEAKAVNALAAREIEAYCPRILEPVRPRFGPLGPLPLFPGYVFTRFVLGERFAAAQYCAGSLGLVRLGGQFAAVEEEIVAGLRLREGERGYVMPDLPPRALRPGSRVRIAEGALAGLEGVVTRYLPAKKRVQLLLAHAWRGRPVEVDAVAVRCA
ncbi:MAG TPA: transcription termination/antitermination NusG family protein [Vicinamibacteria bacterium]|nr:transcription termination/antitermination NusG family protein [Vicinamibacteria bacterium]